MTTTIDPWALLSTMETSLHDIVEPQPDPGYLPIAFRGEALDYANLILDRPGTRGLVAELHYAGAALNVTLAGTGVQWDDGDNEPYIEAWFFASNIDSTPEQTIGPLMRWKVQHIERLVIV